MEMSFFEKHCVNSAFWNYLTKKFLYQPFLRKLTVSPKKILELGCGVGKTTKLIAERFPKAEVTAIDYDPDELAKASPLFRKKITFLQGDATYLPFETSSFDAVFSFMTFHHIEDYNQALKECRRVLKKGGYLYTIDLGRWTIHRFKMFPAGNVLSKDTFVQDVLKSGFRVERYGGNELRFFVVARK